MEIRKLVGDNFIGGLSISRCNHGFINIRLRDSASRTEFVSVRMTPEDFANCVTGLSETEVRGEVKGLQYVGKKKVSEARQSLYPGKSYDKVLLAQWLEDEMQEEGWIISTYLNSPHSVRSVDGGTQLNYSVTKYI